MRQKKKLTFGSDTMSSLGCRLSLIYSLIPCDPEHSDTFAVRMISPTFAADDR